ncbi:type III pantothenate kinase [Bordetella petrii]|uniref:Type III pantothenate kinase n=1 Tax=Bordetella petrii (strain ATCC BAA-461 / DSM 12804 / CCUG 43448 / CIP 107267 / Se-1111R) TaxID=340100 RepID=COAX_BORPD|nr:type III pantothenate kinase [Bordetella petrii]A9IH79.1 RecName: Full=Type III pantothenate kinase; AltName: Full=PanK-III; AltName: Full=Pantothenic acid kinase [Bordetella petrii DSM 12804]CAP45162.1 transcriptional regulator [Bordetella petrii]
MILLIDSGNSRLKVGWLDNGAREPAAVAFDNLDPHALGDWLGTLSRKPTLALGVNVAGAERGEGIRAALAGHGCPVHWITSRPQLLGLRNGYTQPAQLGADRLVSLLGVRSRLAQTHPPFVLASFGTATTIDTVGPDNAFAGGLILPGPALMRSSLARGTANLPLADGPVVDFPVDTHQAIASGIAAAQAGAVVRQWLAACRHYGCAADIYVAGGGWPEVQQETERLLAQAAAIAGAPPLPAYLDRPVLDGLALLAAQPDPQSL